MVVGDRDVTHELHGGREPLIAINSVLVRETRDVNIILLASHPIKRVDVMSSINRQLCLGYSEHTPLWPINDQC